MIIKTEEQLQKMKEIGFICATIRDEMVKKAVPGVSTKELDNIAKEAFYEGIKHAVAGRKINQIGKHVHKKIKEHKLQVIENLTGHGIGTSLHQEPQHVFNYFDPWDNLILKDGMCLAVEPFVSTKAKTVGNSDRDEWELVANDGSYIAQYEHTIVVRENAEPLILTKID